MRTYTGNIHQLKKELYQRKLVQFYVLLRYFQLLRMLTDAKGQTIQTTYDNVGNVATITDKRGIVKQNVYDEANQLLNTTRANVLILTNEYDGAGNVTACARHEFMIPKSEKIR